MLAQHDEIDALNATLRRTFRVLKGIEADILADGTLDYDDELLDRFDFVVGSVHSRFAMDGATMTDRVLRALDDPHLTILGHPTGRLLLVARAVRDRHRRGAREGGASVGVAVELNADPHRLDLDWRHLPRARDARRADRDRPRRALTARTRQRGRSASASRARAGSTASDVLNTRSADDVLAFARARRARSAR